MIPRLRQRPGGYPSDWPLFRCPRLAGFGCPPRLRRVIRTHGRIHMTGPDEAPIAQVFARRLAPLVERIDEALRPIFRPGAGF